MLGGWKVEGVSELSDLILQSGEAPGISRTFLGNVWGNSGIFLGKFWGIPGGFLGRDFPHGHCRCLPE